jgi:succinate dehydrogenase/fumarate reductase flavoprotein subunit
MRRRRIRVEGATVPKHSLWCRAPDDCASARTGTATEGLYAAGEVTGLYYNEYPAGTSVLRAFTFGRIAAREAAAAAATATSRDAATPSRPAIEGS